MELLENVGIGIALILILIFGFYFLIIGMIFMLGLPQVYAHFMLKLGKRLEKSFPKLANTKGVKTGFGLFLIFSGMAVFVGAMVAWFGFVEWLP
jgi:hypothetical protein